jgi:hypothetical protein
MKPIAVDSTTLNTVAYVADRQLLQLEFRNRTVYHYFHVPADVYEALMCAPSKGTYFNSSIRGLFAYARVQTLLLS